MLLRLMNWMSPWMASTWSMNFNQCTLALHWIGCCHAELTFLRLRQSWKHVITQCKSLLVPHGKQRWTLSVPHLRLAVTPLLNTAARYGQELKIQSHKHDWLSITQYHVAYFRMSASHTKPSGCQCWLTFLHQTCFGNQPWTRCPK